MSDAEKAYALAQAMIAVAARTGADRLALSEMSLTGYQTKDLVRRPASKTRRSAHHGPRRNAPNTEITADQVHAAALEPRPANKAG